MDQPRTPPSPGPSASSILPALVALTLVGSLLAAALLLVRGMTYQALAALGLSAPHWVGGVISALAEIGLLVLVGGYLAGLVVARAEGRHRLAAGVAAGAGVVIAYGTSEVVEVLVGELRPCRNFGLETLLRCPPATDWAWPSNHATLAAALLVGTLTTAPRLARLLLPVALAVALARVLVGVHYPHDVVAGLVLGAVVALVAVRVGAGPVARLLAEAARRSPLAARLLGARWDPGFRPARPG